MATAETQQIDEIISSTRRRMFTLGGAALAGLALAGVKSAQAQATVSDTDILNFALSLEFLGANYYSLGLNGVTIDKASPAIPTGAGGKGTGGSVTLPPNFAPVPFTYPVIQNLAQQLLADEIAHVTTLQSALGSAAVAMADIDYSAFTTLFNPLLNPFNPFQDDAHFMLGAFVFEDVDTSAYHGAAPLISDRANVLPPAVQIHSVEAQHAGLVRTVLIGADAIAQIPILGALTAVIAQQRATLSGVGDVPVATTTVTLEGGSYPATTLVDADANALAFARTTSQVLNIVTAGNAGGAKNGANYTGGFFPNGINGNIR
jgi:hypothetical protein